jgi:hypothetical protein
MLEQSLDVVFDRNDLLDPHVGLFVDAPVQLVQHGLHLGVGALEIGVVRVGLVRVLQELLEKQHISAACAVRAVSKCGACGECGECECACACACAIE